MLSETFGSRFDHLKLVFARTSYFFTCVIHILSLIFQLYNRLKMCIALIKTTQQPCRDKTEQTCCSIVLRISQRSMRDVDLGPDGDVPKAGYLCARSVSFLLRLSPKRCTKEHKALLQSVCPRLAAALKPSLLCHTNT